MANSNTEHSRKLRNKTANEYNRKLREQGLIKTYSMQLSPELGQEFNEVLKRFGSTKKEAVRALCDFVYSHQGKQNER